MKTVVITVEELKQILDERLEKALAQTVDKTEKEEQPELLTRHDLARIFGVSLVTINEWCRKGILTPHHMNSRVYFYKSEVMEALSGSKYGKRNN